jgi:hypothetical protein
MNYPEVVPVALRRAGGSRRKTPLQHPDGSRSQGPMRASWGFSINMLLALTVAGSRLYYGQP